MTPMDGSDTYVKWLESHYTALLDSFALPYLHIDQQIFLFANQ